MELINYDTRSMPEMELLAKKFIYASALGALGSVFLAGEQWGTNNNVLGFNIPAPVAAGLGIGVGSVASNTLTDMVLDKLIDDPSARQLERTLVQGGLSAVGAVGGLYVAGYPPSVEGAILGVGSYVGSKYLFNMDDALLGRLF